MRRIIGFGVAVWGVFLGLGCGTEPTQLSARPEVPALGDAPEMAPEPPTLIGAASETRGAVPEAVRALRWRPEARGQLPVELDEAEAPPPIEPEAPPPPVASHADGALEVTLWSGESTLVRLATESHVLRMAPEGIRIGDTETPIAARAAVTGLDGDPTDGSRIYRYRKIADTAELVLEVDRSGRAIEQVLILNDAPRGEGRYFELVERLELEGPDVEILSARQRHRLPAQFDTEGDIAFFDAAGERLFHIRRPVAFDSGRSGGSDAPRVRYRVHLDAEGRGTIRTLVPMHYLRSPSRVYPVRIDPPAGFDLPEPLFASLHIAPTVPGSREVGVAFTHTNYYADPMDQAIFWPDGTVQRFEDNRDPVHVTRTLPGTGGAVEITLRSCQGQAENPLCTVERRGVPVGGGRCEDIEDPCLRVSAQSASSCRFEPVPDGVDCDDGNACTLRDVCIAGTCVGAATVQCDDNLPAGELCRAATCNPDTGACESVDAGDGTVCSLPGRGGLDGACVDGNCLPVPAVGETVSRSPAQRFVQPVHFDPAPIEALGATVLTTPSFDGDRFRVITGALLQTPPVAANARVSVDALRDAILEAHAPGTQLAPLPPVRFEGNDVDAQLDALLAEARVSSVFRALPEGFVDDLLQDYGGFDADALRAALSRGRTVHVFEQIVQGAPVEQARVVIIERDDFGPVYARGRLLAQTLIANTPDGNRNELLDAATAELSALLGRPVIPPPNRGGGGLVLLPVGDVLHFARKWRLSSDHGAYDVWVDAAPPPVDTRLLQINPLIDPLVPVIPGRVRVWEDRSPRWGDDTSLGIVDEIDVEVAVPVANDPAQVCPHDVAFFRLDDMGSDGNTSLCLGGPNSSSGDWTAAPFVAGTNLICPDSPGYNGAPVGPLLFGTLDQIREFSFSRGGPTLGELEVWFNWYNEDDPSNSDNAWAEPGRLKFGVMRTRTGRCPTNQTRVNTALDPTVAAHEYGHLVLAAARLPGGDSIGPMREGFADYFAYTWSNRSRIGAFVALNGENQGGSFHRAADDQDRFPEHRYIGGENKGSHADGQIISRSLWLARRAYEQKFPALGRRLFDTLLFDALGGHDDDFICMRCSDETVHDAFLEILFLLFFEARVLPDQGSAVNDLVMAFARSGLMAAPQLAIVDYVSDADADDFHDRSRPPEFRVVSGRNFRFGFEGVRIMDPLYLGEVKVELAADPDFTQDVRASPWRAVTGATGERRLTFSFARFQEIDHHDRLYFRAVARAGPGAAEFRSTCLYHTENGTCALPYAPPFINLVSPPAAASCRSTPGPAPALWVLLLLACRRRRRSA